MSILSLIAAMDSHRLIGRNNQLPWHLPADLQHFKATTMGKPIIMGRKTWESLGRPLPGRMNIVITRNESYIAEGATVTNSLDEALQTVRDSDESVIIGGANLYAQALSMVDRLHLTRVEGEFEGDAWFPEFSEAEWVLSEVETHEPDEKNQYSYRFETYDRRS
jgi:dihydrofolate reductase